MAIVQEKKYPLIIYSASAGSGKTFSLVQEFLKLTLGEQISPMNFAKIIAMTFTNKAALEMKERMIQALFQLSVFEKTSDIGIQNLMESTHKNLNLPKEIIKIRAKKVLTGILHNYENFNVFTIDKFNLRLIRTFSRDLDLQDNFEVTLDQQLLLEQVIDELIDKIGEMGEEQITSIALRYATQKLNDETSWDFRNSLIQFSKVILEENQQQSVEILSQREYGDEQIREIIQEIEKMEIVYRAEKDKLFQYFESLHSVPADYPSKTTGIYKFFITLPERELANLKPIGKAAQATLDGENINANHNVDTQLIAMCKDFLEIEQNLFDEYFIRQSQKKNFYHLSLLKYIKNQLEEFKTKKNLIGIYEFGQKISALLKKENASYIYERLGNRYSHYLLDEFQDTSRLQWLNIIPLIHESIAHVPIRENLIVGDAKQAIYRFRNGVVEQFVALPKIYNPEKDGELAQISNYFEKMGEKKNLKFNYRSKKEVVDFNNEFFERLLKFLPPGLKNYYEDIHQIPNSKEGGFVSIDCFNKNDEEFSVFQFLLDKIAKVLNDGYQPGDICILTRFKKQGNEFAQFLTQNEYKGKKIKVVSADSLIISTDKSVQFCIDYLNLRRNSGNKTFQIKFATSFYQQSQKDPIVELASFWKDNKVGVFNFQAFLEKEFINETTLFFPYESLFDLGSQFFALTHLNPLQNPYLHCLLEIFQKYDLQNGPDIRGFIEDWNSKLKLEAVIIPENKDAIKISTIHKSKGLEFPVVIIPHLSWDIKPHKNSHFIHLDNGEILYENLKSNNVPSFISEKRELEYQQILLDELNILYVAFTRPKERLYVFADMYLPKNDAETYSTFSYPIAKMLKEWHGGLSTEEKRFNLSFGKPKKKTEKSFKTNEESTFIPKDLHDFLWFPEIALQDADALEKENLSEEQLFGNQLHIVLSKVKQENNIDEVIEQLAIKGRVEKGKIEALTKIANQVFQVLQQQDFVKNAEEILNEQDILMDEKNIKRPDKIYLHSNKATIVDFKTGKRSDQHKKQVQAYCKLMPGLGFEHANGYLLYTKNMELEKVV